MRLRGCRGGGGGVGGVFNPCLTGSGPSESEQQSDSAYRQETDTEPCLTRVVLKNIPDSSCNVCDAINIQVQSARQQAATRTNGGTALTWELVLLRSTIVGSIIKSVSVEM